ncbi:hypothetical protein CDD83_7614 [Cordyceps sp. RAO-2017]|nr:hypothetical protein CDD83_7614 [Cordyceps sp. RAO-2017]
MSPPTRRRSARLASAGLKPKAAPELASVAERDETPPRDALPSLGTVLSPAQPGGLSTPVSSAVRPPRDEMHPSKARPTTGEPSSALRLGFSDIPSKKGGGSLAATPSKIGGLPASPFTFRLARDAADTSLSSEAQRMMDEIRDQAAKIKADLVAQREADGPPTNVTGRVIAKLKRKSGRFSAAHTAEFSKMDSIEGHASAWRAQNGRFTPVKSSLKRSPSKANLDATPLSQSSCARPSPSKMRLAETPDERPKRNLKRTSTVADLDGHQPGAEDDQGEAAAKAGETRPRVEISKRSAVKRLKQHFEDDSSSSRPPSHDASSLPRPVLQAEGSAPLPKSRSGLARLMSPTKASLGHSASPRKATISMVPSPSKTGFQGLPKSASAFALGTPSRAVDFKRRIISPGRFQRVKSILRGQKADVDGTRSAIPQPSAQGSQTPAPPRTDRPLPAPPLTTPRRKLAKRVDFTPDTAKAAMLQDSPSPQKPARPPLQVIEDRPEEVDEAVAKPKSGKSLYPDLSPLKRLVERRSPAAKACSPSTAGTFTFRSDHTIQFGDTANKGFGVSPGQSSVRRVRGSVVPATNMPGSFPAPPSPSCHPNKENAAPSSPVRLLPGTAHGMPNKKRHRASSDEEDSENEAAERALKKRKNEHVPEGQALLAPRLLGKTPIKDRLGRTPGKTPSRLPGRTPGSASPSKKGSVLSVSRLNMLARPKNRG